MDERVSLFELLTYLRNYFPGRKWGFSDYAISGGEIVLNDMWDGDFYLIEGSRRNDGIHVYGDHDLLPEAFSGTVTELKIDNRLLKKWKEINSWCRENDKLIRSPYQSESFGGYSYSKTSATTSWKTVFADDLKPWRKL